VVKQLAERRRARRAPGLLAIQAVQVQVREAGQATARVNPPRRVTCVMSAGPWAACLERTTTGRQPWHHNHRAYLHMQPPF